MKSPKARPNGERAGRVAGGHSSKVIADCWTFATLRESLAQTETVNPLGSPEIEFDYVDVSSVSNDTFEIRDTQRLKGKDAPSRARRLIRKDDVLFATIRPTLRRIAVVPTALDGQVCSTGYFVMRPKPGIHHRFLFYYLFSEDFMEQMEALQTGASYPAVNDSQVRAQIIPVPPLAEQRRIVGILDEAFAGIATAKANAEKNLRNASELYDSYQDEIFVQRSGEWEKKTVGDLVTEGVLAKPQDGNHGEIHPVKADFVASGVPFIMAADLQDGLVNTTDCRFIAMKQATSLRIGFAEDGDVLISHKGTIGHVAVLKTDEKFVVLTPQVTYYRILKPEVLAREYLPFYLRSPGFQSIFNDIAGGGSTRAYIGITRQLSLSIIIPPVKEQVTLARKLSELHSETERLMSLYQQKLTALDALKKSLLHQAFSGQL